jgi:flagellar export protein FliJ
VLQWRALQKEREEGRLHALLAEAERLEAERLSVEANACLAEESVCRPDTLIEERQALGNYRRFASKERRRLLGLRKELEGRIEAQRRTLMEAERKVEALNHMRDDKLAAWRYETDKEQTDFVDGLVVSRWRRPLASTGHGNPGG